MRIKLIFLLIVLTASVFTSKAQDETSNALSLSKIVSDPIRSLILRKYNSDSTRKSEFDHTGYLFLKFQIVNNRADSIKFMEFGNAVFKEITTEALNNLSEESFKNVKLNGNEKFFLPILYDFKSSGWLSNEEKLKRIPNLLSMPGSVGMNIDFMNFFSLDNIDIDVAHIYMLRPLRVVRPSH